MACREIDSPITGERVTSKLWNQLRELTGSDEEADKQYLTLLNPSYQEQLGDWINNRASVDTYDTGEPTIDAVKPLLNSESYLQKSYEFDSPIKDTPEYKNIKLVNRNS